MSSFGVPVFKNLSLTVEEIEADIGEQLKTLRLTRNLSQSVLAERADVSIKALQNLESGKGSTLRTLISVVRALGRQDWFNSVAPVATINPLTLTQTAQPRQRAASARKSR